MSAHLVGLDRPGVLQLGVAGLLADLPVDLRQLDWRAARAHEADWCVADLRTKTNNSAVEVRDHKQRAFVKTSVN